MRSAKNFKIAAVSIDEPSIGLNPELAFDENDIISALTSASKRPASGEPTYRFTFILLSTITLPVKSPQ